MYAILSTSGSQYKIEEGAVLEVNRMKGNPGDTVTLDSNVMLVNTGDELKVGNPFVSGVAVNLEIVEHLRGKKLIVFKMKRRKRFRRKQGHRQELTRVKVMSITVG